MPIIQFDGPSLSESAKEELAQRLTTAAGEVLSQIPKEAFTVVIRENKPENIAVGGRLLSQR